MQELRIVKTLETVLARGAHCGMFLARFYKAPSCFINFRVSVVILSGDSREGSSDSFF